VPTDIRIIAAQDFIRAAPDGTLDLAASRELLKDLATTVETAGVYQVLIDTRGAEDRLSTIDLYELGVAVASLPTLARNKTALLIPHGKEPKAGFFEDVTRNRGVNLKAFADFETAIAWLILKERS
jgi:hypothetical protein